MLFGKKIEKEVFELLVEHINYVRETVNYLNKTIETYIARSEEFRKNSYSVHEQEHLADEVKKKIETKLADGAFIPIIREDYGRLVELVDRIADKAEHTSDLLTLTKPNIPDEIKVLVQQISEENLKMVDYLIKTCDKTKEDVDNALNMVHEIEAKESFVDKLQWDAVEQIFNLDIDLSEKLLLKMFVDTLAGISDRVELAGDQLGLMLMKKNI